MAHDLSIETVYQDKSLAEKQPLWRNFFVGRQIANRLGFIDIKREKEVAQEILIDVIGFRGVGITVDSTVANLSGGERQGIAIGRAMHYNADLIVLDEPTAALGVAEVRKVIDFVRKIKQSGRACIYIEHNLAHVHEVADRLVVLDRGHVVSQINPKDMTVAELTEYLIALQHKGVRGRKGMVQRSVASLVQRFEALPIIIVFILLLALFMNRAPEVFLAPYIYTTFLSTLPPLILLAAGLTFVIGAGEIDLCFPSIIAFSGFVFAVLFKEYELGWLAVVAGLASGVLVGFVNGLLIAKVGIPSFMTTLATQFFWAGMATVLSGGKSYALRGAEESSVWQWIVGRPFASVASVPWLQEVSIQALWTALIVGFLWLILTRHRFGEHTLFIGDFERRLARRRHRRRPRKDQDLHADGLSRRLRRNHSHAREQELLRQSGTGLSLDRHRLGADRRHLDLRRPGDDRGDGVRLLHHRDDRGRPRRGGPHRRLGANGAGAHLSHRDHLLHVRRRTAAPAGVLRQSAVV